MVTTEPFSHEAGMLPQDHQANHINRGENLKYQYPSIFLAPKFKFAMMISNERELTHQIDNFF